MPPRYASAADWLGAAVGALEGSEVLAVVSGHGETMEADLPVGTHLVRSPASSESLPAGQRFRVGLVIDALDALPAQREGEQLLGRLRDLHCDRVEVLVPADSAWSRTRMLALEYTLSSRVGVEDGREDRLVYAWDIATYNPERDWNNAEHWANPENFDRYRW